EISSPTRRNYPRQLALWRLAVEGDAVHGDQVQRLRLPGAVQQFDLAIASRRPSGVDKAPALDLARAHREGRLAGAINVELWQRWVACVERRGILPFQLVDDPHQISGIADDLIARLLFDDQGPHQPIGHLQGYRTMLVGMIPVGARGMKRWQPEAILL